MTSDSPLSLDALVGLLRACGEPTRLRMLALLAESDLTVSDMIEILGQSQPRISRHLKLLNEAGLLERYQEGSWAFFRLADQGAQTGLVHAILERADRGGAQLSRDRERLEALRKRRANRAAEYFSRNASDWDQIRSLHVDEDRLEAEMLEMAGEGPFEAMLDLGTGTGRVLELFAGRYERGVGIDASRDMLSLARTRLDAANLSRVQTRQGDITVLPLADNGFDLVTVHQVLHFLDDPAAAIQEAVRVLAPGGKLLIVDFAPHDHDFLRTDHAHVRLGFSEAQMGDWLEEAGLRSIETRHLAPEAAKGTVDHQITVTIWLARKP